MGREAIRQRARLLAVLIIFPAFAILGLRLFYLQVVAAPDLLQLITWRGSNLTSHPRGIITDTTGTALALSLEIFSLAANPRRIENKIEVASRLAPILGQAEGDILAKLSQDRGFVWLARRLSSVMVEEIRALRLAHVDLTPEYIRVYPYKNHASHILGIAGLENRGLEGIELHADQYLRYDDEKQSEQQTVVLTMNSIIQHIAEEELTAAVTKYKAAGGVAVVLEVKTGAILAMASLPNFDPNDYTEFPRENLRNRVVTDVFEPGSIFKIFVASSALDQNLVRVGEEFECHRTIRKWRHTYSCYTNHGRLNFSDVIIKSCNIGMIKVVERLEADVLYRYLRDFGFGLSTGIDLPGEVSGTLRKPFSWSGLTRYSMAIGYEVTVTPLQILSAAAAIANRGQLQQPYIVREIRDRHGNVVKTASSPGVRQVINPRTAQTMLRLMRGVVEEGTGGAAAIEGFSVAGKTGTARLPNMVEGGYHQGRYIGSFIGIAPVDDPRLAILVSITDPDPDIGYYGGVVAAPAFSRITKRSLDHLGITPLASLDFPAPTGVARSTEYDHLPGIMPDLHGVTLNEVIALLGADYVRARIDGSGMVTQQEPAPGASTWLGEIYVKME